MIQVGTLQRHDPTKNVMLLSYRADCSAHLYFVVSVVLFVSQWMINLGCVITEYIEDRCFKATLKYFLIKS